MRIYRWYRVVGTTFSGAPKKDIDDAHKSFDYVARQNGYDKHQMGTARAAVSARVIGARTRQAAKRADVSRAGGRDWQTIQAC